MNNVAFFEIQADDVAQTIEFYGTIFGWTFTRQEGVPFEFHQIETEGIRGGIMQRPAPTPGPEQGSNAFVCSMQVANFDKTAESIISQYGTVALPKFAVPGKCWQGYFTDPAGNTFGIFQVDELAV